MHFVIQAYVYEIYKLRSHRSLNVKKTKKFTFTEMANPFLHDNHLTKCINGFSFNLTDGHTFRQGKFDVIITRFPAKLYTCTSIKQIFKDSIALYIMKRNIYNIIYYRRQPHCLFEFNPFEQVHVY